MSERANEYQPDSVTAPGATLSRILRERALRKFEFALRTGLSDKTVSQILHGKAPISPETALAFERVLGIPASFWNNRQKRYDEYLAREAERRKLSKYVDWSRGFNYAEMAKFGWVPRTRSTIERLDNLLHYLGLASPEAWDEVWAEFESRIAYRRPQGDERINQFNLAAWLRQGAIQATRIDCKPFSKERFRSCLPLVRSLSRERPEVFTTKLREICANCGVAVVFVRELPKTASGCTRWLSPEKALIQLSLRYKSDDHLWFTFFHEAGHILLHQKRKIFLEDAKKSNALELEADRFATEFLVPASKLETFLLNLPYNSPRKVDVVEFADRLGISPGIVVGRLQHEGYIPQRNLNKLKRPLTWEHISLNSA